MSDALDSSAGRRWIYRMRHSELCYFDADSKAVHPSFLDLTERGQAQTETMGELLAGVPFDRALCTGSPRTVKTAQGVLAGRNLVLESIPGLNEICSDPMGDISGAEIDNKFVFGMDGAICCWSPITAPI